MTSFHNISFLSYLSFSLISVLYHLSMAKAMPATIISKASPVRGKNKKPLRLSLASSVVAPEAYKFDSS